jgi:hypothetical protein
MTIQIAIVILALMLCAPLISSARQADQAPVTVGPAVRVSRERSADQSYETQLAADPVDPTRLIGCAFALTPEKSGYISIIYASRDGGKSWSERFELNKGHFTQDPSCIFGGDGVAYAAFLGSGFDGRDPTSTIDMYFLRSQDGGWSWQPPAVLPWMDRENIAVDLTDGQYRGRIYLNGTKGVRSLMQFFLA